MEGLTPEHVHEVRQWLGLVPLEAPQGLHGDRRGMLMVRHARIARKTVERPQDGTPQPVYTRSIDDRHRSGRAWMVMPSSHWRWVNDALAATYARHRKKQIMALLRPQGLDDRLWRWVYALMVQGGPVLLPDLIGFVARLTGPRDIALAEALDRMQQWQAATREDD